MWARLYTTPGFYSLFNLRHQKLDIGARGEGRLNSQVRFTRARRTRALRSIVLELILFMGKTFDIGIESLARGAAPAHGGRHGHLQTFAPAASQGPRSPTVPALYPGIGDAPDARIADAGKSFYIETFGCQMNAHDSEKVSGVLLGGDTVLLKIQYKRI